MNVLNSRKLWAGGLAVALLIGGAMYAYAENGTSGTLTDTTTVQGQGTQAPKGKGDEARAEGKSGVKDWRGESFQQLATILGMSADDVHKQLKAGKSIADLAQEKGIAKQDVIDKLTAAASQKVDDAVKEGRIPQEKADQIKQRLPERMQQLVERKGLPEGGPRKFGHGGPAMGMMPKLDTMAGWFGITKDELAKQLKDGKTLADIAAQHGMKKEQLIAKIQEEAKPKIEKFVSNPIKHDMKHGKDVKQEKAAKPGKDGKAAKDE